MNNIFAFTLDGLKRTYYFRQIFFALVMQIVIISVVLAADKQVSIFQFTLLSINTLLYPYSRYLYESIMGFLMGENIFFVSAIFMLFFKAFTMAICWSAAVFIAPFGLAYLYYQNSRTQLD